jgi:hypothetical protein
MPARSYPDAQALAEVAKAAELTPLHPPSASPWNPSPPVLVLEKTAVPIMRPPLPSLDELSADSSEVEKTDEHLPPRADFSGYRPPWGQSSLGCADCRRKQASLLDDPGPVVHSSFQPRGRPAGRPRSWQGPP